VADVLAEHRHGRSRRLALEELRMSPVRRVVDHDHHRRPAETTLEPVVFRAVHLNQFPPVFPTRTPLTMRRTAPSRRPPSRPDQPLPQRLLTQCLAIELRQILHGQRGTEIAVLRPVQLQHPLPTIPIELAIRSLIPQPMHQAHSP
jgi:hypothetical protein